MSDLGCEDPVGVLGSNDMTEETAGENILELCNNKYWRPPVGKTRKEAEIIVDLKCQTILDSFSILNRFGDFGTKKFSLHGSRDKQGPWTELFQGELTEGMEMTEEVNSGTYQNTIHKFLSLGYSLLF